MINEEVKEKMAKKRRPKRKKIGHPIGERKMIEGKNYTLHSKFYSKGKAMSKAKGLRRYHDSVRVDDFKDKAIKKSGAKRRTVWGVYTYR